jgi:hypothetical protein
MICSNPKTNDEKENEMPQTTIADKQELTQRMSLFSVKLDALEDYAVQADGWLKVQMLSEIEDLRKDLKRLADCVD